ncbi:MAG: mannose-1-phosphate guanylyltransferase [Candidatus Omnitrophota bacterium]|nr:mannose-1-phosphate guanylyltransferase [Candidatus Omnitrophota bacterium]
MARKKLPTPSSQLPTSVYAVILVGGIGKRLQPLSKPSTPKPFLSVTKDRKTIFAKTIARIRRVLPIENIIVVANKRQAHLVRKSSPKILRGNLLLEKASKNTAPAIALASLELRKRSGDAVVVVLPADHYIGNESVYLNTLKKGIDFVKGNPKALVTIGLEPNFPATGYGYIKIARGPCLAGRQARSIVHGNIYKVERFVEKPDIETARKFIGDGNYLWNTGTFIFKAVTFLGAVRRLAKSIYEPLKDMRKIEEKYDMLPNISVDYAIMEKAYEIYCVKGSYKWEDIGSFDSLKKVLKAEGRRFIEKDGKVLKIL